MISLHASKSGCRPWRIRPNRRRRGFIDALAVAVFVLAAPRCNATYNFAGQGMQTVLSGTVANASLYMGTSATWTNMAWNPAVGQPYNVPVSFALPPCDNVVTGRLVLTLWGGTPDYTANLSVSVNSNALVSGGLNFGSTTDSNASFSATQPSVYGSGYGVWLVGLPVNTGYLHTDGSSNLVAITVTTSNSFDGRIMQVSLLSIYQQSALSNQFQYAIAEGSGDIYNVPTSGEVCSRTVAFGGLNLAQVNSAALHALYTYAPDGQNNRLYFNGTQFGGDGVAEWDPSATGLDYGPSIVDFNVTSCVASFSNNITFSVCSADVPSPVASRLRPQIAVLTITGPTVLTPWQQWQMLYFSCTNCPQAQPNADPYGKGISNTNQFLLGLNPTNPASVFAITSVVPQGNDVQITWKTSGGDPSGLFGQGKTNLLEYTAGDARGGFTNDFASTGLTNVITTLGNVLTNATDRGGATNGPARYYRVRLLVP